MQHKVENRHFMVQGSIPVNPKKTLNEVSEDECAVFNFREAMAKGRLDLLSQSWSVTPISTVASFLQNEGIITVKKPTLQVQQRRLTQFHVHSNPDVLKYIGKFCLKSGRYADLAINALHEYLLHMTYSKMFTMAAGIAINDEATVQSGYTLIRDETMLMMSQALSQLASERRGRQRTEVLDKAQTLLDTVQVSSNAGLLGSKMNLTHVKL